MCLLSELYTHTKKREREDVRRNMEMLVCSMETLVCSTSPLFYRWWKWVLWRLNATGKTKRLQKMWMEPSRAFIQWQGKPVKSVLIISHIMFVQIRVTDLLSTYYVLGTGQWLGYEWNVASSAIMVRSNYLFWNWW